MGVEDPDGLGDDYLDMDTSPGGLCCGTYYEWDQRRPCTRYMYWLVINFISNTCSIDRLCYFTTADVKKLTSE